MNNNGVILLKTLLLSTSSRNILKYSKDKKKKGRIIGNSIGMGVLYAMLLAYCILMCIGYGMLGLIEAVPIICALTISSIAFVFTILKTNGYLFNFKEYDMLMSLPFEVKHVAACKFLYMFFKSLPWYLCISLSMMIGYGLHAHPAAWIYIEWIILALALPIIPMLAASFIGFLIARASAGFKKTNIVQTVLTFIFIIICFSFRFILEALFRDNKIEATIEMSAEAVEKAAGVYVPAKWFADAINQGRILSALMLLSMTALLFVVIFRIVGKSYRNINSALKSHAAASNYKMTAQKKKSVVQTIAYKEFKRFMGSTLYMTQAGFGAVLAIIMGILSLIVGFNRIVMLVTQNAPFDYSVLQPAIPFIVYFFIGMLATTACSPSLEGKNYWILQSLPVEKKTIYQGKMLFNMYLSVPFMCITVLMMCISAGVPFINTLFYLILGIAMCTFSTTWGCVCGIKHMRLDWENEIEVIKQGSAVSIYLLPNMLVNMGLIVLVVLLGMKLNHILLAVIFIAIVSVLAALSYMRVMSLCKKNDMA